MHAPLVVLGGGPGGYAAAFRAADGGLPVVLVESQPKLGGTCLLRGCIPSKSLLHVARVIAEAQELEAAGIRFGAPRIDLEALRSHQERLIGKLTRGLDQLVKRRKVTRIVARGRFQDSSTLKLEGDHPSVPEGGRLTFDHCIVATGSVPAIPVALKCPSPRVIGSAGALQLETLPSSLLVVGGGYIGLEMATIYARLGCAVTVVEFTDQLLPGIDADLVKPVHRRLSELCDGGILLGSRVTTLTADDDSVTATVMTGGDQLHALTFDRVLIAVGRRPNTKELGLEHTHVELDSDGFMLHDAQMRTADPRILAIGDAAGQPMLAHKASHEGRIAAEVLLGEPAAFDVQAVPAVVFTDPEIATCGLSESGAKAAGIAYETALYPWAASGRAQAVMRTDGMTKFLVDPSSKRVLGCGIVGVGAGELIAEAVLAMEMGATIEDVAESIHPHPTLSETLMHAGHAYMGTATEIYKPRRERKR